MSSNTVHFKGQYPDTFTNTRFDPIDLCPNIVDPQTGVVSSLAYQFEFQSDCSGESGTPWGYGSYRPPFIWSLYYVTENGHYYNEQWQDQTDFDYSKVRFYMYDRVPFNLNYSNQAVQLGSGPYYGNGNPRISGWGDINNPNIQTNAVNGEVIVGLQIECTGYNCGLFGVNDHDIVTVRYKGNRPQNLAIAGNPAQICRSQAYTVNWDASFGATGYVVQTSVGTITSSTTGTTAQLLLPDTTPNTVRSVTITVGAQNGCGGTIPSSATTTLTLFVAPAPAQPTNMQLDNGLCPTTISTSKNASVTPVGMTTSFEWTISGPGAYFAVPGNPTTYSTTTPSVGVKTPQPGAVTITSQQKTACGGFSTVLSKTYQIDNIVAKCPTPSARRADCGNSSATITFDPSQAGLNYYTNGQPYNVSTGAALTISQSLSGSNTATVTGLNNGPVQFDQDIFVTSPCAGSGAGFAACTVHISVGKYLGGICPRIPGKDSTSDPVPTQGVNLYPNPTNGLVEIQPVQPTTYHWVKVVNVSGRVLYEKHTTTATGISSFDMKELPMGIYNVQLYDGKRLTTQRIVRE